MLIINSHIVLTIKTHSPRLRQAAGAVAYRINPPVCNENPSVCSPLAENAFSSQR
jgi:hypothetical protein